MYQRSTVTISMRELDRLKVIQSVVDGELRASLAAERLGMSPRQVRRLAHRYRTEGPVGLVSRRRNRPSNRRTPEALENQIARILRDEYPDFGPTLAMETTIRDQGAIVENKRLSHALEALRAMQARRESGSSRSVAVPTHGRNGTRVARSKIIASHKGVAIAPGHDLQRKKPELLTPPAGASD